MKLARPKSLKELAVEEIRARIIDGRLQLGEALSENSLAADLGISKTPVREALQQLESEGLVDVQPQRGSYVFHMSADHVVLISDLREVLEIAAAADAMERNGAAFKRRMAETFERMQVAHAANDIVAYRTLDGYYHQIIIDLCGNPYFQSSYGRIGFRIQALRSRLSHKAALNDRSFRDHRKMLALIRRGDVGGLQTLLRSHIRQTQSSYLEVLRRDDALSLGTSADSSPMANRESAVRPAGKHRASLASR